MCSTQIIKENCKFEAEESYNEFHLTISTAASNRNWAREPQREQKAKQTKRKKIKSYSKSGNFRLICIYNNNKLFKRFFEKCNGYSTAHTAAGLKQFVLYFTNTVYANFIFANISHCLNTVLYAFDFIKPFDRTELSGCRSMAAENYTDQFERNETASKTKLTSFSIINKTEFIIQVFVANEILMKTVICTLRNAFNWWLVWHRCVKCQFKKKRQPTANENNK